MAKHSTRTCDCRSCRMALTNPQRRELKRIQHFNCVGTHRRGAGIVRVHNKLRELGLVEITRDNYTYLTKFGKEIAEGTP